MPRPKQLVVGCLVVLAALLDTRGGAAQTPTGVRLAARVEGYVDTDHTEVLRPRVSADVPISDTTRLAGSYTADVVSSASIDVVSRASQRIRDDRHELTGSVSRAFGDDRLTLTYAFGTEVDFRSHSGTIAYAKSTGANDLGTLVLRAGFGHANVGAASDPDFSRSVVTATLSGSFSQIVNETLLVRAVVELANVHGFQSSAYRTVRIGDWTAMRSDGSDPDAGAWVFSGVTATARERTPLERFRARLGFDLVQALPRGVALALSLASYVDSYRIRSGEIAPELRYEPRRGLLFRAGGRIYAQSAAWFWRQRYQDPSQTSGYVTDDKELGPMQSYEVHVAAQVPVGDVRFETRVEGNFFRYPEFTLLTEKRALVASLGVVYQR